MRTKKRRKYRMPGTAQVDRKRMGLHIFRLRDDRGLTQSELAEKMGLCEATVGHWESGRYIPSLVAAKRLAGIFGIPLDELAEGLV